MREHITKTMGISESDFAVAAHLKKPGLQPNVWWVGKYELVGERIVDVSLKMSAGWRAYRPLEDEPGLFFAFADLRESQDFQTAALDWVRRYGLPLRIYPKDIFFLDMYLRDPEYLREVDEEYPGLAPRLEEYVEEQIRNPPSMHLEELRDEVEDAWETLAYYEAHASRDMSRLPPLPGAHLGFPHVFSTKPKTERWMIHGGAKAVAAERVADEVADRCRLLPLGEQGGGAKGTDPQATFAWTFDDLIGAMHLQMMWTMEKGVSIGRCKFCSTLLPTRHAAKEGKPLGRKVRDDRTVCGDVCRMAYNRARKREKQEKRTQAERR